MIMIKMGFWIRLKRVILLMRLLNLWGIRGQYNILWIILRKIIKINLRKMILFNGLMNF